MHKLTTLIVAATLSMLGCSDASSGPDFEPAFDEFESTPDGPMCLEIEGGCFCALEEFFEDEPRDLEQCPSSYDCCGIGQLSDDGLMGCACIDVSSSECERNISKFPSPLERVDACTSQLVWDEF
jgi:hypothetical protein